MSAPVRRRRRWLPVPVAVYHATASEHRSRPSGHRMRTVVVFARLLPFVLSFLRDRRRWLVRGASLARSDAFHRRRATTLVETIGQLGPTWIKLAQVFAARSDLIPEPYLGALSALTDRVPPVPIADVEAEILRSYGRPIGELFERFDPVPVAAASLGQVHRARLAGRDVAVKVLRPNVEALVDADLVAARRLLDLVVPRFPNPHLRGMQGAVAEFGERIADEMDFRKEARHAAEIAANFADNPRVIVPRVVESMTRQRVMVMEFIEGTRIDRLDGWIRERRLDPGTATRGIMEIYIQMMLIDGFFHADPHPGNILVTPEGRIVLLDFGMVVRVPLELRRRLVAAVFAAIRRDVAGVVDGFYALGLVEPGADRATIERLTATLLAIANTRSTTAERLELLSGEIMEELYDWPIVLPREMVYFARAAALIEGIGTRYDPHFNAIAFASPIALRLRGRIMRALGDGVPAIGPREIAAVAGELVGSFAEAMLRTGREVARAVAEGRLGPAIEAAITAALAPRPRPPAIEPAA